MTKNIGPVAAAVIPVERIERAIVRLRGRNVVLAHDLAEVYGVETRALNQAVKRNADAPVIVITQIVSLVAR